MNFHNNYSTDEVIKNFPRQILSNVEVLGLLVSLLLKWEYSVNISRLSTFLIFQTSLFVLWLTIFSNLLRITKLHIFIFQSRKHHIGSSFRSYTEKNLFTLLTRLAKNHSLKFWLQLFKVLFRVYDNTTHMRKESFFPFVYLVYLFLILIIIWNFIKQSLKRLKYWSYL